MTATSSKGIPTVAPEFGSAPSRQRRPLGPARQPRRRPYEKCEIGRQANRSTDPRFEAARTARYDADRLVRRIRSNPVRSRNRWARPQPLRLLNLARRRRYQRRHDPRRHGRIRLPSDRKQGGSSRPARHDAAFARRRPHQTNIPIRRSRHAIDGRPRPRGQRDPRLTAAKT